MSTLFQDFRELLTDSRLETTLDDGRPVRITEHAPRQRTILKGPQAGTVVQSDRWRMDITVGDKSRSAWEVSGEYRVHPETGELSGTDNLYDFTVYSAGNIIYHDARVQPQEGNLSNVESGLIRVLQELRGAR